MMDEPTLYDRFLVTDETKPDVGLTVPGDRLADPADLEGFLEAYAEQMGAQKITTAASRFNYHMMRPMLKGPLYCLGRWSGRFTNAVEAVTFQEHTEAEPGHEWGVMVYDLNVTYAGEGERDMFRDTVLRTLIDDHFAPVFGTFREVTGIGLRTLWENLAHVLTMYYDGWIEDHEPGRERFVFDFERLHDSTILGEGNPLAEPLRSYSALEPINSDFERTTCCLNYRLERYCARCPLPGAGEDRG